MKAIIILLVALSGCSMITGLDHFRSDNDAGADDGGDASDKE